VAYGSLEMNRFRWVRSHSLPAQGYSTGIPARRPTEIDSFPAHEEGGLKKPKLQVTVFFIPPFKPSAKWCSNQGKLAGVSDGIGVTNACTRMYRLAFIAEHGMRSYKAILGPLVPGAREGRP